MIISLNKIVGAVMLMGATIWGGTKPPKPPEPPQPSNDIAVAVDTDYELIRIRPAISAHLIDTLSGKRCIVQIARRNASEAWDRYSWETIKTIESYDLGEIIVEGVFISGGKTAIRRVRLYWPDVDIEKQGEVE